MSGSAVSMPLPESEKSPLVENGSLDPPRTGAAEVVRLIPGLRPEKILYISCDPSTLARDIGILRGYGYVVSCSRPVDMFPQTHHIESMTLLEPAGAVTL
jgi:tRNA/tmRNA/rRNA uracil-C5-methylase (TrmA/RlmC/RlmD family)